MWRFSYKDVAAGATQELKAPIHGRVQPLSRRERRFTDVCGFLLLSCAWLGIVFAFFLPFYISEQNGTTPDDRKLTFGMAYNGACFFSRSLFPYLFS